MLIKPLRYILLEKNIKESSSLFGRKMSSDYLYISCFQFSNNKLDSSCISMEDNGSKIVIDRLKSNQSPMIIETIYIDLSILSNTPKIIEFINFKSSDIVYIIPINEIRGVNFIMGKIDDTRIYCEGLKGSFKDCNFYGYNINLGVFEGEVNNSEIKLVPLFDWNGQTGIKNFKPYKDDKYLNGKTVFDLLYGNGNQFYVRRSLGSVNKTVIFNLTEYQEDKEKADQIITRTIPDKNYDTMRFSTFINRYSDGDMVYHFLSKPFQKKIIEILNKISGITTSFNTQLSNPIHSLIDLKIKKK